MKKKLRKKSARNNATQSVSMSENSNMSFSAPRPKARRPKGKLGKRKTRKTIRINGLDLLHNQTLLSTSPQGDILR